MKETGTIIKREGEGGLPACGLQGAAVLAFESRRATELAALIRHRGGVPSVVPSLREVPLEENSAAFAFLRRLERREVDVVIMLTGVGVRTLAAALSETCTRARLASLLRRTILVARGPKPVAALRELGLKANVTVPEPNTWREVLAALDTETSLQGLRVAVQEYGKSNSELIEELEARGAAVLRVPVYLWALPEDRSPLEDAVRRLAHGSEGIDFVVFLSATQVDHVMQIANELGLAEAIVAAARRVVVASIGPVCTDALSAHGLPVDLEPEHPKMGNLVVTLARRGPALLARKRAGTSPRR